MPKTWEKEAAIFLKIAEIDVKKRVQMFQPHDFKKFPELTNEQLSLYGGVSPHEQHTSDFMGQCVKVMDGDTIKVQWSERNFPTKIRFANVAAAELGEGGEESKQWLTNRVLGKEVEIKINTENRTGKYGRLLGRVYQGGMDVGRESALYGHVEVIR